MLLASYSSPIVYIHEREKDPLIITTELAHILSRSPTHINLFQS